MFQPAALVTLLAARGMGLARAAELMRYPGPRRAPERLRRHHRHADAGAHGRSGH